MKLNIKKIQKTTLWRYIIVTFLVIAIPIITLYFNLINQQIDLGLKSKIVQSQQQLRGQASLLDRSLNHMIRRGSEIAQSEGMRMLLIVNKKLVLHYEKVKLFSVVRDIITYVDEHAMIRDHVYIVKSDINYVGDHVITLSADAFDVLSVYTQAHGPIICTDDAPVVGINGDYLYLEPVENEQRIIGYAVFVLQLNKPDTLIGEMVHLSYVDEATDLTLPIVRSSIKLTETLNAAPLFLNRDINIVQLKREIKSEVLWNNLPVLAISLMIVLISILIIYLRYEHEKAKNMREAVHLLNEANIKKNQLLRHELLNTFQVLHSLIEIGANQRASTFLANYLRKTTLLKNERNNGTDELESLFYLYHKRANEMDIDFCFNIDLLISDEILLRHLISPIECYLQSIIKYLKAHVSASRRIEIVLYSQSADYCVDINVKCQDIGELASFGYEKVDVPASLSAQLQVLDKQFSKRGVAQAIKQNDNITTIHLIFERN